MLERKTERIELVEGTTRFVQITCLDQDNVTPFDFDGYDVRTWLSLDGGMYVPTVLAGNIVSYEIPAAASVGEESATAETRIFKDAKVFEIIHVDISIVKADKADLEPEPIQSQEEPEE